MKTTCFVNAHFFVLGGSGKEENLPSVMVSALLLFYPLGTVTTYETACPFWVSTLTIAGNYFTKLVYVSKQPYTMHVPTCKLSISMLLVK